MNICDQMSLVLITHEKTKYKNSIGVNENFVKLAQSLDLRKENIFIIKQEKEYYKKLNYKNKIKYIRQLEKIILITVFRLFQINKDFIFLKKGILTLVGHSLIFSKIIFFDLVAKKNEFMRKINRQNNISESHIMALRIALKNKKKWIIIVEDDILVTQEYLLKEMINKLLKEMTKNNLSAANISLSFNEDQLGTKKLRKKMTTIIKSEKINLAHYEFINVNTVCATIYSIDIVEDLIKGLEKMRNLPLVPIDYKINDALIELAMTGKIFYDSYASLINSPIKQHSLM